MKQIILAISVSLVLSISSFGQASDLLSVSAKAAFNQENYAPCIVEMTKLIKLKPKNDAAYAERARCVFLSGDGEKGYNSIRAEKAKTIHDEDRLAEATNLEFDSRRTRTIDDATKAIKLNPNNAAAYNIRGLARSRLVMAKTLTSAELADLLTDFDKAIKIDPKFIKPYLNRGTEFYRNNAYDAAIADFKKAVEIDPKNDLASKLLAAAEKNKPKPTPSPTPSQATASVKPPTALPSPDRNIEKILASITEINLSKGAELIAKGVNDFNKTIDRAFYQSSQKGDVYFFAMVSEYDPKLNVNDQYYTYGGGNRFDGDHKATFDKSTVGGYSVVLFTTQLTPSTQITNVQFQPKSTGITHWLLFRKR